MRDRDAAGLALRPGDHLRGRLGTFVHLAGYSYHHPSAEDAWRRIFAFFAQHLRTDEPANGNPG